MELKEGTKLKSISYDCDGKCIYLEVGLLQIGYQVDDLEIVIINGQMAGVPWVKLTDTKYDTVEYFNLAMLSTFEIKENKDASTKPTKE